MVVETCPHAPKLRTHYRYLKDTTSIYLLVKPALTSRHTQYYTRYKGSLNPIGRHALYGFMNKREVELARVDHAANIFSTDLGDAKLIAHNLNMPLVIELSSYCELDDRSLVEEIFFWRSTMWSK